MKRTYTTLDRTDWQAPPGPWDAEPDKVSWTDRRTGLPCLAVRHGHSGHWCGYVGLADGHPAFEKTYDDVDVRVHGGLTYADHCQTGPEDKAICHIPEPGQPDHVWWLGFDCAHSGDVSPGSQFKYGGIGSYETYRTLAYVQRQCRALARQLVAMAAPTSA